MYKLVVLRTNADLAIFQPYLDLKAGNNQSLKIQVARPGIEPRSSYSASQELNYSATAAPYNVYKMFKYLARLLSVKKEIVYSVGWYVRMQFTRHSGSWNWNPGNHPLVRIYFSHVTK